MAALKWDEQAQAYVETQNVPMRYDADSGAWVETTGMAYDQTSGAWEEKWSPNPEVLYLFNSGDECTAVTGGWKTYAYGCIDGYTRKLPNVTVGNETLFSFSAEGSGGYEGMYAGKNLVNFTSFSKLKINVISTTPTTYQNAFAGLYIIDSLKNNFTILGENVFNKAGTVETGVLEIDVSGISSGFVCIRGMCGQSYTSTVKFKSIWLEK